MHSGTFIHNGSSMAEKNQIPTYSDVSSLGQCEDSDALHNIIRETVTSAYGGNLGNFSHVIKYVIDIFCPKMKYIGLTTLYDAMERNGQVHTNEMMILIYWIKTASSDTNTDTKLLSNYDELKAKIPSSMRSILFSKYVRLLNVQENEYMYEADFWVAGHRMIFTWVPGGPSSQDIFYFDAQMEGNKLYFIIRNDFFIHGSPICQSSSYYSPERRKTVTCPNEGINNSMKWYIEPVVGTSYFKISNWDGTMLYSPIDDYKYDQDRRYVFTWQQLDWAGSAPGYWIVIEA